MGRWKSNMPKLVRRVAFEQGGKSPTQTEISEETGIRQATISAWMQPDATIKRLDGNVIAAFLEYFNRYFDCDIRDLCEFEIDTKPMEAAQDTENPSLVIQAAR